jgi:ABC-type multidrug transport system fused ATPase/permease subunit
MRALLIPISDDPEVVAAAPQIPVRVVFRRFWPDARPYRRWIPVLLVLIAIGTAISTVEIWAFKLVVDEVLVPGTLEPLAWIAALYLGLTLLGAVVSFADDYLSTWIAERFLLGMRSRVFGHLQTLGLDVFDRRRTGDLISRVTSDVQAIEGFVLSGVADGLAAVLRIVFFAGALFILDWQLALIAIVVAPLFWIVAKSFSRLIKHASREQRRRSGSLSAVAEESFSNAALIQALGREPQELERFRRENEGMVQAELASTRIRGLYSPVVDLIELAGVLLVFALGTVAVTQGDLTIGGLLVFVAYLSQLYSPVRELSSLANAMFRALAGAERVIELLDERPRVVDAPGARPLGPVRGQIAFEAVSFTYPGGEEPALRDVDLRAAPGERIALVGPSGAGKSTIARLAARFYDPESGVVRFDGVDLRDATLSSVRGSVSMLLQDALLLHGTIRENIAMGRPSADDDAVLAAARAAGVDEFVEDLEHGWDTDVGERGRRLSGGQRQRVAIARALISDAPILILDEPSTGLDARAKAALSGPLRNLMRDRTTLVISHDLLTTRDADVIVVLDRGQVVERGGHAELLAARGLYERLWQLHDTGEPEPVRAVA